MLAKSVLHSEQQRSAWSNSQIWHSLWGGSALAGVERSLGAAASHSLAAHVMQLWAVGLLQMQHGPLSLDDERQES